MNNRNYQRELEAVLSEISLQSRVPRLLLHSCCAPCSSYVLEYLAEYFSITVFYYNPNITPQEEYEKRVSELRRLIGVLPVKHPIRLEVGKYEPEKFFAMAKGLENEPEGGSRCQGCYRLRLNEAAMMAASGHYDYFATTLTISPMKNARNLNEIGEELGDICRVNHLPSDFKKKNGYQRSVELSAEYGLYRQDYCGCVFSKREQLKKKTASARRDEIFSFPQTTLGT